MTLNTRIMQLININDNMSMKRKNNENVCLFLYRLFYFEQKSYLSNIIDILLLKLILKHWKYFLTIIIEYSYNENHKLLTNSIRNNFDSQDFPQALIPGFVSTKITRLSI